MPLETIFSDSTIKATDSAVNIFGSDDIALGINIGSSRIAFKHNDILFKTAKVARGDNNITFVTRPSISKGFVGWYGSFSATAIIHDLLKMNVIAGFSDFQATIDGAEKKITIVDGSTFEWNEAGLLVDGMTYTGANIVSVDHGEYTIEFSPEAILSLLSGDFSTINTIDYVAPSTAYDLSYSNIDWDTNTYEEIEIEIDYNLLEIDEYGHQYFSVTGYPFYISSASIWFKDGSPEYLPIDQYSFVADSVLGLGFAEFSKDHLKAAINTSETYNDGLIECSERTYIGYARVYSSYVYVDYYYIKPQADGDECAQLEDSISYGRACRLKVSATAVTIQNISADVDFVALVDNANDLAAAVYDKIRFGAGCFSSNYKMYSYRDKRDTLEVIFNRESSSKYIKVIIEDQPTRYRSTMNTVSGTKTTTSTKNLGRYSANPVWSIGNTATINMPIKKALDNVSDTTETLFTNSALTVNPDTIKIFTRTLYVNILDSISEFPQMNLTYSTFAVVAAIDASGTLGFIQITFQPATGAIYGRIQDGSGYTYLHNTELVEALNVINVNYEFLLTCNISSLNYTDLSGVAKVLPFSNSTMVIAEKVNGGAGIFYRVYYKNADSYGFVNAETYEVEE